MSATMEQTEAIGLHAHLWQPSVSEFRWVVWNAAEGTMVFDTELNCPVYIDDEPTLRQVLGRMREAGVPEGKDYPGRPCS
ncbi:hypothetical protein [Streptomyces venezuelae]|nr:hypothetical protein [Streptomyces venezuelae]